MTSEALEMKRSELHHNVDDDDPGQRSPIHLRRRPHRSNRNARSCTTTLTTTTRTQESDSPPTAATQE